MKMQYLQLSVLLFILFILHSLAGCCSNANGDCEEGVTVKILTDSETPGKIEDMTVRWTAGDETGKAVWRPKEDRFFIAQTSDVLGDSFEVDVVLDATVIFHETYQPNWQTTVCGEAEGASWCKDDTYEWAEIEIDLRGEEE